jgi:DNA-binding transcriptional LysR family regulator
MLAKLDDYVTETRNNETGPFGTLRIQATSDYARFIVAALIIKFAKKRPGVRVHLSVVPDNLILAEDSFDVIISIQKPSLPGVVGRDLGAIPHVICASPDYFRRFGRPKTPHDLREHNCLADLYSGPKSWPFQNSSRRQLVEVKGSPSSNSNAVLIQMALNGCGIIRVPLHAVKTQIAEKELEVILKNVALSPERMCAYYAKAKRLPAKTADFITFLASSIGR